MNDFSIITACIRPENLSLLYQSILDSKEDLPLNLTWYIVMDARKREPQLPDVSWQKPNCPIRIVTRIGEPKNSPINTALQLIKENLKDTWILWLDDDNLMHPHYFQLIQDVSFPAVIIYHQQLTKKLAAVNPIVRLAQPNANYPGSIDTGQFTISSNLIGRVKWDEDNKGKQPDGQFIKDILYWNPENLVYLNHIMAYYNYLK